MSIAAQLLPILTKDFGFKFAKAAVAMEKVLDAKTPVDTGLLMRSQHAVVRAAGPVMSVTIFYPLDYAEYQDKPVATIKAKRGKFLRFEGNGGIVYVKQVTVNQSNKGWFSDTVKTWPAVLRAAWG